MKWFGDSWGAPVCDPLDHMPTPEGSRCGYCEQDITRDDRGFLIPHSLIEPGTGKHQFAILPWHVACFVRSVIPTRDLVHILHHGRTLCGMPPGEWPRGQTWVSLEDKSAASCPHCLLATLRVVAIPYEKLEE